MRSSASHPAGPHGRLAQKPGKSGPHCWGMEVSTQFAQQFISAVTAPPLVGLLGVGLLDVGLLDVGLLDVGLLCCCCMLSETYGNFQIFSQNC